MNLKIKGPAEIMKYFMIAIILYIIPNVINGIILLGNFSGNIYYETQSIMSGGGVIFYLIGGLIDFLSILYFIFGCYHALSLILVAQSKNIGSDRDSKEEISE